MLRLSTVNKELKRLGYKYELVKGGRILLFCGEDNNLTSVYVYTLNDLTLDRWVGELESRGNGN